MLSKKMAFSLMSLITLLAFAFIAVPAMAEDDFDATFSVDSISTSSDHNAQYGAPIVVTLTFGAKVDPTKAVLTVLVEDKFGAQTPVTPAITLTADSAKDIDRFTTGVQNNSQVFTFTIPGGQDSVTDAEDVKVHLYVAKAVPELVLGSEKTSKAGALTIDLVGPEPLEGITSIPTVVKMETSTQLLVPADGYTGGAFDVVITLSEKPAAFAAAQVGVDKGTPGEPVYLGAIAPIDGPDADELVEAATGTDSMHHQYRVTITPKAEDGDLVVKVNEFEDQVKGARVTTAETRSPSVRSRKRGKGCYG